MGRAIVRNPQVFCMDEPLSNLDAKMRVQTRTDLAKLQRDLGVTTVYVTHDQTEAMTMGDRVGVMKDGELQQVGAPMDLYDRPANVFVAGFIGSPAMKFLDAELSGASVTVAGHAMTVHRSGGVDGPVVAGVRPEGWRIAAPGPASPSSSEWSRCWVRMPTCTALPGSRAATPTSSCAPAAVTACRWATSCTSPRTPTRFTCSTTRLAQGSTSPGGQPPERPLTHRFRDEIFERVKAAP